MPDDAPDNPLYVGSALHKGIEKDTETGIKEYFSNYTVITDANITEAIKLEYWISKVKEIIPGNSIHEFHIESDFFNGYLDLLVPATKLDASLPHGLFDLYDFKYSNSIDHYMQSGQLSVYKAMFEKITGKRIRNLYFMFIPKVSIKQKKTETIQIFRNRVYQELDQKQITIKQVQYDPGQVEEWYETVITIPTVKEFQKKPQFLCRYCEFNEFCQKGRNYMILPSSERRKIGQATRRKIWIYGAAFSGKTTFVDSAPKPLNLNTDGNIQFVTMPYISIKDTYEGRQKKLAWAVFKEAIDALEKKDNDFETIVVDLLEDTYQSCRLYMYDKLGITHESDDTFRAWDEVRTEFLSTIRRLMNLDYENIILISHEDTSRDITRRTGDKVTAIKPNIQDKIANKIAGMVDLVARVVVNGDERSLQFKSDEVVFGGGRLKNVKTTSIPLDWNALMEVYDEANGQAAPKPERKEDKPSEVPAESTESKAEEAKTYADGESTTHKRRQRKQAVNEPEPVLENPDDPPLTEEEIKAIEDGDFATLAKNLRPADSKPAEQVEPATTETPAEEAKPKRRTRRVRK